MHLYRLKRPLLSSVVWAAAFSTSAIAQTQYSAPRVQVSVFDDARVPRLTLAGAQAQASAIFAQAGVDVVFLDCAPRDPADYLPSRSRCSDVAWPTRLSVRIIPRGRSVGADIFGQAFVDDLGRGVYSNVYYQNLMQSPNHPGVNDGDMLGYVIAHEVGHLLLGTNSHSLTGLMQAVWRPQVFQDAARPALVFSRAEVAALRSRLLNTPKFSAPSGAVSRSL
jgi:hypothetical protein